MDIRITKTDRPAAKPDDSILGFGKFFTDHMFIMEYTQGVGWHDARIEPFHSLDLHPASVVFHYGAEIFEGLKAYRRPDGGVQLFRPEENIARLNRSAERMTLPELNPDDGLQALLEFVRVEQDWVPRSPGTSLYLRPFMFATDAMLGVHSVRDAVFVIIACPVGNYYKEGLNPVSIMIETEDVRAVRGGTGYTKCGGNYGASNRAGKRAEEKGFSQVLWLDGVHRKYVEEVGSMNVMFKIAGKIVTPQLTGSVLPGITRMSCIELLKGAGYAVEERLVSIDEVMEAAAGGTLEECFGTGTAAVVSPVGLLDFDGTSTVIGAGKIGPVTQWLYDTLTDIQWGRAADPYGWTIQVS